MRQLKLKESNKDIGSSLEADVEIYLSDEYLKHVKRCRFI